MSTQANAPVTLTDREVFDLASAVERLHQWADGLGDETPRYAALNGLLVSRLATADLPRLARLVPEPIHAVVCVVCAGMIRQGQPSDTEDRGWRHRELEHCRSALRQQIRSTVDHATAALALLDLSASNHDTHTCGTRGAHRIHICDCGTVWTSTEDIDHTAPEPTTAAPSPAAWPAGVPRVLDDMAAVDAANMAQRPASRAGSPDPAGSHHQDEWPETPGTDLATGGVLSRPWHMTPEDTEPVPTLAAPRLVDDIPEAEIGVAWQPRPKAGVPLAEPEGWRPQDRHPKAGAQLAGANAARRAAGMTQGVPLAERTLGQTVGDLVAEVEAIRSTVERLRAVADHVAALVWGSARDRT